MRTRAPRTPSGSYRTAPYYSVQHHTLRYCSIPYRTFTAPDHDGPYRADTVLFQTVPCRTTPCRTVPNRTTPYCTYRTVPFRYQVVTGRTVPVTFYFGLPYSVPHRLVPCHIVPYHIAPWHTLPYRTPYSAVPCHAVPYHTVSRRTAPNECVPSHGMENKGNFASWAPGSEGPKITRGGRNRIPAVFAPAALHAPSVGSTLLHFRLRVVGRSVQPSRRESFRHCLAPCTLQIDAHP